VRKSSLRRPVLRVWGYGAHLARRRDGHCHAHSRPAKIVSPCVQRGQPLVPPVLTERLVNRKAPIGRKTVPVIDLRFLQGAEGVVMKDGDVYCTNCIREDPHLVGTRQLKLIPDKSAFPGLVQRIISEKDIDTEDFAYVCDKCKRAIKSRQQFRPRKPRKLPKRRPS
jgi:hypothetical protein